MPIMKDSIIKVNLINNLI